MAKLDIEKFNPSVGEITKLVDTHKDLVIQDVNDTAGYALVKTARQELGAARIRISKDGKDLRAEAVAFQKAVIAKEKELIELITPTEEALISKLKAVDEEKLKIKRQDSLPERHEMLKSVGCDADDSFLINMTDQGFATYFNDKRTEFLENKERNLKIEADKVEAAQRIEREAIDAKLKAAEKRLEDEKKKVEADKLEVERAKQHAIDLENAKVAMEAQVKAEAEEKIQQDILDKEAEEKRIKEEEVIKQQKLEAQKKYQDWLKPHGYVEGDSDFKLVQVEGEVLLYKLIDTFQL